MPPTRVPSEDDFAALATTLPHTLHFHSRPSTTSIMLFFHGLGDSHTAFSSFARSMNIPGTLSITVRGPSPLPAFFVGDGDSSTGHFHWGDDVTLDSRSGRIDPDPGFARAVRRVWDALVQAVLVDACGWTTRDIVLFGYGQGGSFALALALHAAAVGGHRFKGVVSLGGPVPRSALPSVQRDKVGGAVLLVQVDAEEEDLAKDHFASVQTVRWKRPQVDMPRNREEMLPIMTFIASCLREGW